MSIEKGDATKYVHTGNGELCYEMGKVSGTVSALFSS